MKLDLKEWISKATKQFGIVMPRVASFTESYTLYANTARTVTITPANLGLSGVIDPLLVTVTSENARYNNWFMDNSEYIGGTGINIRFYSPTARTEKITVKLLYRQVGGVVRKLLKALKPLTLGRGWAA